MRSFILACSAVLVFASIVTAPAPVAEAEAPVQPPAMDTLADIKAEATHWYYDQSCTFVQVRLRDGDQERVVRIGLDAAARINPDGDGFGCAVEED